MNGISHLFFRGKAARRRRWGASLQGTFRELYAGQATTRSLMRIVATRLGGPQKYKKSSEEPSPAELAALDEVGS